MGTSPLSPPAGLLHIHGGLNCYCECFSNMRLINQPIQQVTVIEVWDSGMVSHWTFYNYFDNNLQNFHFFSALRIQYKNAFSLQYFIIIRYFAKVHALNLCIRSPIPLTGSKSAQRHINAWRACFSKHPVKTLKTVLVQFFLQLEMEFSF